MVPNQSFNTDAPLAALRAVPRVAGYLDTLDLTKRTAVAHVHPEYHMPLAAAL
jgi:hypothetical protein